MGDKEGIGATGLKTKLIINYLPQSMTDEEFVNLFTQYGETQECKIVRDKQTHYSFGFGFVDYIKPGDAVTAINKLNGFKSGNKSLKVAFSKPPGSSKNANLYITGLGKSTTEKQLYDLFSVYGSVIQTRILRQPDGSSKEVGFVLFKERPHADSAINSLNGYSDGYGMNLEIKHAKDQQQEQKQQLRFHAYQSYHKQAIEHHHRQLQQEQMQQDQYYPVVPYGSGRGGVSGRGAQNYRGGQQSFRSGQQDYSGGQQDYGEEAQEYGGGSQEYGGGYGKPMRHRTSGAVGRGGAGGARYNPIARPMSNNPMGNNQQMGGANLPIDPSSGAVNLFVYNIGPNAQDSDLYTLFCRFGRINKVNVVAGKGFGFVHMPVPSEAQSAIDSLNDMPYQGKNLQVSVKANNK